MQAPENSIKIKALLEELVPLVTSGAGHFDKKMLEAQLVETVLCDVLNIYIRSPPFLCAKFYQGWHILILSSHFLLQQFVMSCFSSPCNWTCVIGFCSYIPCPLFKQESENYMGIPLCS